LRRWTERHAREALAELESTGESTSSFARRKGISAQRIARWRRRLDQAGKTEFVAVALPAAQSRWIEIRAGDVVVRVREELDADHVASGRGDRSANGRLVLTLPPGARVFVATARVDGRKGSDGLSSLLRSQFAEDPLSGTMFVFFSRRA
jgi:transposase-like protein